MTNATTFLESIIGQERAKRKLGNLLAGYTATQYIPNLLYVAPKGQGKTKIARETAKVLHQKDTFDGKGNPQPKPYVEVNASSIKNLKQFWNGVVIPFMADKPVTVFIDEASELPRDVTMALLTIAENNDAKRTTYSYDDYTVDFDWTVQTLLLATSEPQKVFHALADRFEKVELEDYTHDELSRILVKSIKSPIKFKAATLRDIASVLRGNARAAVRMAERIETHAKVNNLKEFTMKDWEVLRYDMGIFPLGLTPIEVNLLRKLTDGPKSLTCLSAKSGMSKEALQRDVELYLQRHSLLEITTEGRTITGEGRNYLTRLDAATAAAAQVAPKK